MQSVEQAKVGTAREARRRRAIRQRSVRELERTLRRRAVAFCRWLSLLGLSISDAAVRLGIAQRTLEGWLATWKRNRLRTRGQGRPAQHADRSLRHRLLALIDLLGPSVGVPTLQALCPDMAREEVRDLLRRYRRAWNHKRRLLTRTLHWQRPGSVWAIDFTESPLPIEGCFSRVLAVRDLASGYQLLWLAAADESASTARNALELLFRQYGAPLVLKSDNGSAFLASELEGLLAAWQVWHLYSPPRLPQYNGACEAGIGSMKARTHHQAARCGRAGEWTCEDLEAARRAANETARPWGSRGPTPEQVWGERRVLEAEERSAFAMTVQQLQQHARRDRGYPAEGPLDRATQAAVDREAMGRALMQHDLLRFTSRWIPEPF